MRRAPTVRHVSPRPYDALVLDHGGVLAGTRDGRDLHDVLRAVRTAGLRTAVLSNAGADEHLPGAWPALVDVVVRSGEAGVRKPEPAAYLLVAERLGVAPERCVLVDDDAAHVRGAAAVGMTGVLHETYDRTVDELELLLGVPLRSSV